MQVEKRDVSAFPYPTLVLIFVLFWVLLICSQGMLIPWSFGFPGKCVMSARHVVSAVDVTDFSRDAEAGLEQVHDFQSEVSG